MSSVASSSSTSLLDSRKPDGNDHDSDQKQLKRALVDKEELNNGFTIMERKMINQDRKEVVDVKANVVGTKPMKSTIEWVPIVLISRIYSFLCLGDNMQFGLTNRRHRKIALLPSSSPHDIWLDSDQLIESGLFKYRPQELNGYPIRSAICISQLTQLTSLTSLTLVINKPVKGGTNPDKCIDLAPLKVLSRLQYVEINSFGVQGYGTIILPTWAASVTIVNVNTNRRICPKSYKRMLKSHAKFKAVTFINPRIRAGLSDHDEIVLARQILVKHGRTLHHVNWPLPFELMSYDQLFSIAPRMVKLEYLFLNDLPQPTLSPDLDIMKEHDIKDQLSRLPPPLPFPMLKSITVEHDRGMVAFRLEHIEEIFFHCAGLLELVHDRLPWYAPKLKYIQFAVPGHEPIGPVDLSFQGSTHSLETFELTGEYLGAPITSFPKSLKTLILSGVDLHDPLFLPITTQLTSLSLVDGATVHHGTPMRISSVPTNELLERFPLITSLTFDLHSEFLALPPSGVWLSHLKKLTIRSDVDNEYIDASRLWVDQHLESMIRELPLLTTLIVDRAYVSNELRQNVLNVMMSRHPSSTFTLLDDDDNNDNV